MKGFLKTLRPALSCLLAMTVLCGLVYTALVTGIAALAFPAQANGSIVTVTLKDGSTRSYGSALLEQAFDEPQYLIGRPLAVSDLSPSSGAQAQLVAGRVAFLQSLDPTNTAPVPADLVEASGSGCDPDISPQAAEYQVARIARERGMSPDAVRAVIAKYTTGRLLGFIGEPAVNVLEVNLALDGLL